MSVCSCVIELAPRVGVARLMLLQLTWVSFQSYKDLKAAKHSSLQRSATDILCIQDKNYGYKNETFMTKVIDALLLKPNLTPKFITIRI